MRTRTFGLMLALAVLCGGCAGNRGPNGEPPTKTATIAHYANDVLSVVETTQNKFIELNKNGQLSDDITRKVLDGIKIANEAAGKLAVALRAYDALSATAKQDALANLQQLVAVFSSSASSVFNVVLPPGVVSAASQLASQISKTVMNIQLALAGGA